jgi:large repetitive protein
VTITGGQPPTPTTTTTSDVTITYSASAQAIQVSAHVSPTPPSGTVTFSIPGAGSNSNAVVNAQGDATGNFVVTGGTPSGIYTLTATFNGPANYASSSGTAALYINFYATTTTPAPVVTTYGPANGLTLNAGVTSQFGGTVNTGTVTFTVRNGQIVIGNPVFGAVTNNAASATFSLPAGAGATTYSITAEYGGGGNFAASSGSTTLTVNKAHLTVTADSLSRPAGAPNPTLTYQITGFVNGENASVVSGAPSLLVFTTEVSPPGPYAILVFAGTIGAANYAFDFSNGVLTVTAAVTTTTTTTLPGSTSSTTTSSTTTSSTTTSSSSATSSSTTLATVTTTTSITTTTTLAGGCAQDATFTAIDCRLLALADDVRSSNIDTPANDNLVARLGKARTSIDSAASLVTGGKARPARKRLQQAAKQMKTFVQQLKGRLGKGVRSDARGPITAEANAIGDALRALRARAGS